MSTLDYLLKDQFLIIQRGIWVFPLLLIMIKILARCQEAIQDGMRNLLELSEPINDVQWL